jgi:predicted RNase H-like nuclease (RuvC/YqgF family)
MDDMGRAQAKWDAMEEFNRLTDDQRSTVKYKIDELRDRIEDEDLTDKQLQATLDEIEELEESLREEW